MGGMLLQVRKGQGFDFYDVTLVNVWAPIERYARRGDIAAFCSHRTDMPNIVLSDNPTMLLELIAGFNDHGANIGFVATDWAAVVIPSGLVELVPTDMPLPKAGF